MKPTRKFYLSLACALLALAGVAGLMAAENSTLPGGRLPLNSSADIKTNTQSVSRPQATEMFATALNSSFAAWDSDHDGTLAESEIDAALADSKITGNAAAALAVVKRLARGKDWKTITRTLDELSNLASAPKKKDGPDIPEMFADAKKRIASANRELFAESGPKLECLHQGKMGDCFSLAPLGAMLHRDAAQVRSMFKQNDDGTYEVVIGTKPVRVAAPTDAEIALSSSNESTGLWSMLYEKAAGTARNELRTEDKRVAAPLDAIARGGSAGTMLAFITGHEMERFTLKWAKDEKTTAADYESKLKELRGKLVTAFSGHRCVTTGTLKPKMPGLRGGHAYAVIGYDKDTDQIRVWDPHGDSFKPKGAPGPETGFPRKQGICDLPLTVFVKQFTGLAFEILPAATAQLPPAPATQAASTNAGHFYTWPDITRQIDSWKQAHPRLIHQESLGKTAEGRDIPILKISQNADRDERDKPQLLLLGGIHPREQHPQIAAMRLIADLLDGYGHNDRITRLVNTRQIWIVPVLNVDGKIYDMKDSDGTIRGVNWRKNRSKNADGSFGVDLNRNFASRWGGASEKPAGNTFQGTSPLSEPETLALADFLESHPIRVFVDMHSHMKAIFHPQYLVAADWDRYAALMRGIFANQKSRYRTYTNPPPAGTSPPDVRGGDTGLTFNWTYYAAGPYSFNIEIGGLSFYDPPARIEHEYADNIREPLLHLIDHCADVPVRSQGTAQITTGSSPLSLKAGDIVHWKPQITGSCDYAVLMSLSPLVNITSEYRACPIGEGYTIKVSSEAKPGTSIPLKLYLWTREHARSTADVMMTITGE